MGVRMFECLLLRNVRLRGREEVTEGCMVMSFLIGAVLEGGQMEGSERAGCMESKGTGLC